MEVHPTKIDNLVGGIATPLTNMKVSWDDYPIYYGKIKFMFQTTNQNKFLIGGHRLISIVASIKHM
jgi:hypothetical protein